MWYYGGVLRVLTRKVGLAGLGIRLALFRAIGNNRFRRRVTVEVRVCGG
jgi:hypothetical protein